MGHPGKADFETQAYTHQRIMGQSSIAHHVVPDQRHQARIGVRFGMQAWPDQKRSVERGRWLVAPLRASCWRLPARGDRKGTVSGPAHRIASSDLEKTPNA